MAEERQTSATLAVTLAAAAFAAIGGCLTVPGTLLPVLVEAFSIRLVEAGSMFALQAIGYLLSVMAAGRIIRGFGMRTALSAGMFALAAGYAGFGAASTWWDGGAMMFVSGLGIGIVEVALNTFLVDLGGRRRSNLLNLAHLFFGLGAIIGPAAAAWAVAAGMSWRAVFGLAGGLAAAVATGWVLQPISRGTTADTSAAPAGAAPLRSKLTVVLALLLGVYVGAEMGIGGWLSKYLVSVRGVDLSRAGTAVSLYWTGLATGRLVLSATSQYVHEQRLMLGLTISAAAAFACALLAPHPSLAIAAFALTGLGFSGIFPGVIALAGRSHPQNVPGVTSVVVTGAALGGIIIPWVMSAVADGVGLVAGMIFYLAICGLMIVLAATINALGPVPREQSPAPIPQPLPGLTLKR